MNKKLDLNFYKRAMLVALPIMIQNGITNFVSMLDNIMVGRVGTDAMSGVAIDNQLLFVFNLCIFGGLAGVGIFTAQFYGKGDDDGVRYTFRMQVIVAVLLSAAAILLFRFKGGNLIDLYLGGGGGEVDPVTTKHYAMAYLAVMLFEMTPFAFTQVYATTLRATGETVAPMKASLIAVVVNLVGNYVLIYGKFGAPQLGAVGAAVATLISRIVELVYIVVYTQKSREKHPFIVGAYRRLFHIPMPLVHQVMLKGTPLLVNEALWASGTATLNQAYSVRGLHVMAALNISSTIGNVFNISFIAMGNAIAIIIGQELGAGRMDTVKKKAYHLTGFSCLISALAGVMMLLFAGVFPRIYNTSAQIRGLATGFICISAVFFIMYAFENSIYFILRSGGKTMITFIFDSAFQWLATIPLAFVLTRFTGMPILPLFACVQSIELLKCVIGFIFLKKGIWINDLTRSGQAEGGA